MNAGVEGNCEQSANTQENSSKNGQNHLKDMRWCEALIFRVFVDVVINGVCWTTIKPGTEQTSQGNLKDCGYNPNRVFYEQ